MEFMEKLMRIDRRIIFAMVFLAAAIPMIVDLPFEVEVQQDAVNFYEKIERLEAGRTILLAMDYSPETRPEMDPMAESVLAHCFHKGVRVIGMVNTVPNIPIGEDAMRRLGDRTGAVYGEDYVYLGFKPELRALIISFSEGIARAFPEDFYGTPLDQIPLMGSVVRLRDLALAVSITADDVSLEWLLTANTRFDMPVIMGIASHFYPSMTPYIDSGQILGALAGMKGASEYEFILMDKGIAEQTGAATRGMTTQTWVHLLIMLFVILGNAGYLASRLRRRREA
jgi:hypothetical protein